MECRTLSGALVAALLLATAAAGARVLPETLVLPQCEFYPLREQDRGYLCRYVDQPLFLDPDLPEDAPDPKFETLRHRFWGSWFSQADWNRCEELGKDSFFDGHAFFPRPHRARYWDAMEKSHVRDFCLVPIAADYASSEADLAHWFAPAIRSTRAYRVNGRVLMLSYRFSSADTPETLKKKLEALRARFGDTFAFVCDVSKDFANADETISHGCIRPETEARLKDIARAYLRACDGVIVGDAHSMIAFEGPTRDHVLNVRHYEAVARILNEVVNEPEFRGRKILGLSACIAHENSTVKFWTAAEDGLKTLTESLRIAASVKPDVILMPEWDEFNENTCVGPTLLNGLTVKRLMNFYQATLKNRPLRPLPNDATNRPNLVVSYRRTVSPGARFFVDILNIPDGGRAGRVEVAVEIADARGAVCQTFPAQSCREDELCHLRFPVDSAALAEKTRAPQIRVRWRDARGASGTVSEGLHPVDLEPANEWCLKEVHQPLRDLAPMTRAEIALEKGVLRAALACDEPIRFASVLANGEIQRVFGRPGSAPDRFCENATQAVFQVFGASRAFLDRRHFAYRVTGASSAEWLDCRGAHAGPAFATDWLAEIGDPYFVRIPKDEVASAALEIDFGSVFCGRLPLKDPFEAGGAQLVGSNDVQFAVTRFRRSARYPSVAAAREITFAHAVELERPSTVFAVQVVTMSGKTWRSRPFVIERDEPRAICRVVDAFRGGLRDVSLPADRIPRLAYEPSPRTCAYLPTADRILHFGAALGSRYSMLTLWNRTSFSSKDLPIGFSPRPTTPTMMPQIVADETAGWALDFDGIDDFIAFPWEVVTRTAAYRLSLNVCPRAIAGTRDFLRSKSLLNVRLDEGRLVCDVPGARGFTTPFALKPGIWQRLELEHDGATFHVRLDDQVAHVASPLPAAFMSSLALTFNGRIRKIVFDQRRPPHAGK